MKMCWKCGKYHQDGDLFCMHCGASFASEDSKYQTDGRTVSNKDDSEYLRKDPPKYKQSHKATVLVIVIALGIAAAIFLVATNNTGSGGGDGPVADVYYNYTQGVHKEQDDNIVVWFDITVSNERVRVLKYSDVSLQLEGLNGRRYLPNYTQEGMLEKGWYVTLSYSYTIPKAAYGSNLSIVALSEYSTYYDKTLKP